MDIHDFLVKEQAAMAAAPRIQPPLLTGDDLIRLGMKPGPGLGRVLEAVRDLQLQEELRTREDALDWVRSRRLKST